MDLYSRSETRKRSVEVGSGIHMYLLGRSINKKKDFVGRNLGGKIFVSDSKQEKKIWPLWQVLYTTFQMHVLGGHFLLTYFSYAYTKVNI